MKRTNTVPGTAGIGLAACMLLWGTGCARYWVAARYETIAPGSLWEQTVDEHASGPRGVNSAETRTAVVALWATQALPEDFEGWDLKVRPPRLVLARLEAGREIAEANRFLLRMRPWNASGSEWDAREALGWNKAYDDRIRLGHRGDYDFTQSVLVSILFGSGGQPDRLRPETEYHLVHTLLTDRGPTPRAHAPRSLGLVPETENHLLMTEAARYLANQWLYARETNNARYDNERNGLGEWLCALLEHILEGGFYEFNSIPYQGYALQAVLNLEAYAACPRLAELSRRVVDAELWRYVFGSFGYRRSVPFRRQMRHAQNPDLTQDRMTQMAAVWLGKDFDSLPSPLRLRLRSAQAALDAAAASYAPPQGLLRFYRQRDRVEYFVRLGRGTRGSPEIHSAGAGYLLSAGGAAPPGTRDIAVRPIALFLEDGVFDLDECFHLPAAGRRRGNGNRTGVHHRFACADSPVRVPSRLRPEAAGGGWNIYRPMEGGRLLVAVHNRDTLGLLAVFPNGGEDAGELLQHLLKANEGCDPHRHFVFPDSGRRLTYEVTAPAGAWVLQAVDAEPLVRDYTSWPRMDGWVACLDDGQAAVIPSHPVAGSLTVPPETTFCPGQTHLHSGIIRIYDYWRPNKSIDEGYPSKRCDDVCVEVSKCSDGAEPTLNRILNRVTLNRIPFVDSLVPSTTSCSGKAASLKKDGVQYKRFMALVKRYAELVIQDIRKSPSQARSAPDMGANKKI